VDDCVTHLLTQLLILRCFSNEHQFKKGWNFIKENVVEIQDYSRGDYHYNLPKKIQFTQSAPASKTSEMVFLNIMERWKNLAAKELIRIETITNRT